MYGYNNMFQPQYNPYAQPTQQPQNNGINWVMGEGAAMAYPVRAGESALLMDSQNRVFYIKTCDTSGVPMPLRIFDYTERITPQNAASKAMQAQSNEFAKVDDIAALNVKFDDLSKRVDELSKEDKHEPAV